MRIEIQDLFDTLDYAERMEQIAHKAMEWRRTMKEEKLESRNLLAELHALLDEELRRESQ